MFAEQVPGLTTRYGRRTCYAMAAPVSSEGRASHCQPATSRSPTGLIDPGPASAGAQLTS